MNYAENGEKIKNIKNKNIKKKLKNICKSERTQNSS